jgi:hypothetical protein
MHTHTLLYKILVEDVFGEANAPTVPNDFKSQWPEVSMAIDLVKRTGRTQELFITGKSHKYKNYGTGGDVKMKVTAIYKPGNASAAEYSYMNKNILSKRGKDGLIEVEKMINPGAIANDFYNRVLQARGNLPKIEALKKGLIKKLEKYGAAKAWVDEFKNDIGVMDDVNHLNTVMKMLGEMLAQDGVLAKGQINIFVDPNISNLFYKSTFYHELTHAFDPKVHLPYRVRGEKAYYVVDPVELDASLNEFAAVAEEFPDELNTEVMNVIKRGSIDDEFKNLYLKYEDKIEPSRLLLYFEKMLGLHDRIKKSIYRDARSWDKDYKGGGGMKSKNKFMQKFMNILGKPETQVSKSLTDRLSDYKGSKKRDESDGFWDDALPVPPFPFNKSVLSAGDVSDGTIVRILDYLYGSLNDLYLEGKRLSGGVAGSNFLKDFPELRDMCRVLKSSTIGDLSDGEVIKLVYAVAFVLVSDIDMWRYQFMRLVNFPVQIDGSLMAKVLENAIGMGWDDSRSFYEQ